MFDAIICVVIIIVAEIIKNTVKNWWVVVKIMFRGIIKEKKNLSIIKIRLNSIKKQSNLINA